MAVFLVGIVGAMVVTQHLRSEGPIASQIKLSVKPGPRYRICFQTPRDDTVGVALVDADERVVAVLAGEARLSGDPEGRKKSAHCYDWDGRDAAGNPVPPGPYRLRLSLEDADRVAISGEKLRIPAPGDQGP